MTTRWELTFVDCEIGDILCPSVKRLKRKYKDHMFIFLEFFNKREKDVILRIFNKIPEHFLQAIIPSWAFSCVWNMPGWIFKLYSSPLSLTVFKQTWMYCIKHFNSTTVILARWHVICCVSVAWLVVLWVSKHTTVCLCVGEWNSTSISECMSKKVYNCHCCQ